MEKLKNNIREVIGNIIFGTDTRAGRLFDVVLLWVILASVLTVMAESVTGYQATHAKLLIVLEWIFTVLFTIEYIMRIWVSRHPKKYIFSFWGIIDLLAFIPTYVSILLTGVHYLLIIRILRLLRIFRILKLTRYTLEAGVLSKAIRSSARKIIVFLSIVLTTVTIMGTLMYVAEGESNGFSSIPESIYWAIVTITTVGYGDITPQTLIGKIISSISMIIGYSIIAIPTGIVTVEMTKANLSKQITLDCHKCGRQIHKDDIFCRFCGSEQDIS
ncbi:ion transporter [Bacteroidota bacterium]